MKSSLKRNLIIGFGFSLVLLIVSSVASYVSIRNLLSSVKAVQHTSDVIEKLERTLSILKDAETGQRGFLITGKDMYLEPYNGAYDRALNELQQLRQLTVDNAAQQANVEDLNDVIVLRLKMLSSLIGKKRAGEKLDETELEKGKEYMDEARRLVTVMRARERDLLATRVEKLDRFASNTPLLILLAAAMSVIITVIFFIRITNDFDRRSKLQKELEDKDADISRRISLIEGIAEKISSGDYVIRVKDEGSDGLGNLAASLNKMAGSLQHSFTLLSDKEWLQAGVAKLNTEIIGEMDMETLASKSLSFIASYTHSIVGALYICEHDERFVFAGGYAFAGGRNRVINNGEGTVGQAGASRKTILHKNIREDNILLSFAAGQVKPNCIIAVPVFFENNVVAVMELAALHSYTDNELAFLEEVTHNIGIAVTSVENRKKLQNLLEETQSQSEELQAQHTELENINEELEMQAQKLQASEEELKVQQEELLQANQELEERSRMLEEKNQLIVERNQEIQMKAEQLALSTKYKSEFLANMSHELRTPLNSILLLSRLMSENNQQNLSDDQVEYARVIQSSGQGLLVLINEILDLSKIEAGKMELQIEPVPVRDVANTLQSLFQPLAEDKKIGFRMEVGQDVPEMVETDRLRLEQILKNFISNALKFTSKGYVALGIRSHEKDRHIILFSVKDTGIGISKDKQDLIFEAFQQEDGSTRRKYGGTGLGLSISRELTRLLGGQIELRSEPGEGSEFILLLPIAFDRRLLENKPVEILPAKEQSEEPLTERKEEAPRYLSDFVPADVPDDRELIKAGDKVILIIEDDTAFAMSMLEFTRQQGYRGVVCVRGDEALSFAKQYHPSGILLDIQLPVKDGMEVMDELKADPATKHIPVHMMSSYEMRYKSLSKGAVDFISKPFAFDRMQDVFEKLNYILTKNPQKVLIVEENKKHAKALAYFLETYNVNAEIKSSVNDGIQALLGQEINCVILDMGVPDQKGYDTLEEVKKTPGLESLPIIIFTGKSLSKNEEMRIRQYADSIVIKTAHSYQRIKDEVSLFLHLVEENTKPSVTTQYRKLGALNEVLRGKTVLIADDDVRNIYSLTRALESFNMNVLSAIDGKEAMKRLAEHPETDIVLMDMMMPEMDGYETTREIKKDRTLKHIPVIAVTAKAMLGDREKCIRAGASDYITKPVDIDQLLSLLRVWLYDVKA